MALCFVHVLHSSSFFFLFETWMKWILFFWCQWANSQKSDNLFLLIVNGEKSPKSSHFFTIIISKEFPISRRCHNIQEFTKVIKKHGMNCTRSQGYGNINLQKWHIVCSFENTNQKSKKNILSIRRTITSSIQSCAFICFIQTDHVFDMFTFSYFVLC